MWCFISEPNGIIHEIFLSKNAVGQECLDKVGNFDSTFSSRLLNNPKVAVSFSLFLIDLL